MIKIKDIKERDLSVVNDLKGNCKKQEAEKGARNR